MSTLHFHLHQEQRRVAGLASAARRQAERSKTLQDLTRVGSIGIQPSFRTMRHLFPELRDLERAIERRAEEIIASHLMQLCEATDDVEFMALAGRLKTGEWRVLPGRFPRLAQLVTTESARLRLRLAKLADARNQASAQCSVSPAKFARLRWGSD